MTESGKTDWLSAKVIAGCMLGNLVTSKTILNATFGVFLKPVTTTLEWRRADFSAVLLIMSIVGLLGYPLAGRAVDRFGFRKIYPLGLVLFSASVASTYFLNSNKLLVYSFFVLTGIAAAFSSTVVLGKPISARFSRKPGIAFALTECGMNLGFALTPMAAAWLLSNFGWRTAYLALAGLVLAAGAPALLLIGRPEARSPEATATIVEAPTAEGLTASQARRTAEFWLLLACAGLAAGSIGATTSHMVPILTDHGFPMALAATVFGGWALASAAGQLGVSFVLDQTQAPRLAAGFLAACILGLALLNIASTPGVAVLGGACVGLSNGVLYGLLPFAVRRYFGPRAFGEIYGIIFGVLVLAGGVAPVLMDSVFDHTGQYALALLCLGLAVGCSAVMTFFLPSARPAREGAHPPAVPSAGGRLLAAGE